MNQYVCRYCRQPSEPSAPTCPLCGAPVDIRDEVSESGWINQPPIRDMARLQFGQSHCQITGTLVPVAEFTLAQGYMVYFSHHSLLWTDPQTSLTNMSLRGGFKRAMAGLPIIMVQGAGPGRLALSDNHAGEIIALPLQAGQAMWVREHRFLCSTGNIRYDWQTTGIWYVTGSNDERKTHYPMGQFGDVFAADSGPGLVLLHSPGNTFIRDLQPGQSLLVQPGALLYKDLTVHMNLHLEYPHNSGISFWSNRWSYRNILLRLTGPGRVAVQSVFPHPEDAEVVRRTPRGSTKHQW